MKRDDEEMNIAVWTAKNIIDGATWPDKPTTNEIDLSRALLAAVAELERIGPVYEAAANLAAVSGYAYVGPGQYEAAGAAVALRDAIDSARAKADKP